VTRPGRLASVILLIGAAGALPSVLPLIPLFLTLQRYWRIDLMTGAVQG